MANVFDLLLQLLFSCGTHPGQMMPSKILIQILGITSTIPGLLFISVSEQKMRDFDQV